MSQSDFSGSGATAADTIKDKVADAAGAVQQASVDAYEAVRDTAQDQPFVSGLLVGAVMGFALGALWKLESRQSLPAHALESLRGYAGPPLRHLRDRSWW